MRSPRLAKGEVCASHRRRQLSREGSLGSQGDAGWGSLLHSSFDSMGVGFFPTQWNVLIGTIKTIPRHPVSFLSKYMPGNGLGELWGRQVLSCSEQQKQSFFWAWWFLSRVGKKKKGGFQLSGREEWEFLGSRPKLNFLNSAKQPVQTPNSLLRPNK